MHSGCVGKGQGQTSLEQIFQWHNSTDLGGGQQRSQEIPALQTRAAQSGSRPWAQQGSGIGLRQQTGPSRWWGGFMHHQLHCEWMRTNAKKNLWCPKILRTLLLCGVCERRVSPRLCVQWQTKHCLAIEVFESEQGYRLTVANIVSTLCCVLCAVHSEKMWQVGHM